MARPRTRHVPPKEALAHAVFNLFLEHGYENTTVADIMATAELAGAGPGRGCASKAELLDAAIDDGISLELATIAADLDGLDPEAQLLRFIQGSTEHHELASKLLEVKCAEKDTYVAYRIRERSLHAEISVMEQIVRGGNESGVYHADFPRQAAEFLVLLTESIFESNFLPPARTDEQRLRVQALLQMLDGWLRPTPAHLAELAALLNAELTIAEWSQGHVSA